MQRIRLASSSQEPYEDGSRYTTRLENAHGIELREFLYLYHPWFGREVGVHGIVAKCGGVYFRCTVAGSHGDRWLEFPDWMFERASCSDDLQLHATEITVTRHGKLTP